ncbi:MAG: hypothetical protein HKN45_03555 [Flavobacteriales bacterium]|nr:hypothetical protein [Flavobacteriales bacterium]NNK81447.1 hypothetical protein [Flavobacteriales bacterium]
MRRSIGIAVIIFMGLIAVSCNSEAEKIMHIEDTEKVLFDKEKDFDETLAEQLLNEYEAFAASYPENEMTPVYLDRAANIARGLKDFERGLKNYQAIVEGYPEFERIIETKFLIAFMYDNEIKDKAKAEEHYKAVAQEYPDHIFGRNAKDRLITLHMSDEELLEFFDEKNKKN